MKDAKANLRFNVTQAQVMYHFFRVVVAMHGLVHDAGTVFYLHVKGDRNPHDKYIS